MKEKFRLGLLMPLEKSLVYPTPVKNSVCDITTMALLDCHKFSIAIILTMVVGEALCLLKHSPRMTPPLGAMSHITIIITGGEPATVMSMMVTAQQVQLDKVELYA